MLAISCPIIRVVSEPDGTGVVWIGSIWIAYPMFAMGW